MLVIVDYGLGNLASVANMLKYIGVGCKISGEKEDIQNADKLILPGVGSFAAGMENIKKFGLEEVLREKVLKQKTPILGICLGMQLLLEHSEEGNAEGLGWIKGKVKRFDLSDKSLKVPHMGWTEVDYSTKGKALFGSGEEQRFYFTHSYHAVLEDNSNSLAKASYGYAFDCGIVQDHIMGVQFHPEKSHKFGMEFLKNFAKL